MGAYYATIFPPFCAHQSSALGELFNDRTFVAACCVAIVNRYIFTIDATRLKTYISHYKLLRSYLF